MQRENTAATVRFIRELPDWGQGSACLVQAGDDHYVVSSVCAVLSGPETLVFKADAEGHVDEWGEVAGGRRMSREEAIADLADVVQSVEQADA